MNWNIIIINYRIGSDEWQSYDALMYLLHKTKSIELPGWIEEKVGLNDMVV